MHIDVRDSGEFKQLLEALIDDLIDARTHYRLHQDLNAAIPNYTVEFNQSAVFWNLTRSAHLEHFVGCGRESVSRVGRLQFTTPAE